MGISYQPGKYWGKLTSATLGAAKSGNPQYAMTFSIVGAIDAANPDGALLTCANYDRTVFRTITEKTKDWFWRDVDSLCAAKGVTSPNAPSELASIDLTGAEVPLECTHEAYEGNMKERWQISHGGGSPEMKPLEGSEAAKLDALFGRGKPAATAGRTVGANPAQNKAARRETAEAGSGIPF